MKLNSAKKLCLLFAAAVIYFYVSLLKTFFNDSVGQSNASSTFGAKPPLDEYIHGWNITKNVNWLLDFSIVGFPKTGTSSLMVYLRNQTKSVFIFSDERCEMGWNQHVPLLRDLHQNYQPQKKMGIKCPRDLEVDLALNNYNKFFPETKFIVGLRDPINWFESFYNFRITNGYEMPPAQRLVGRCKRSYKGVCTDRANFSKHLEKIESWRKVFLYDVSQLTDGTISRVLLDDLGDFLDLKLDQPMIHVRPGQNPVSGKEAQRLQQLKMNICLDQYVELRKVLLEQASRSSAWIRDAFITNPNVKVSSPKHFSRVLESWGKDPCEIIGSSV